jgi:hypothetical protein
MFSPLLAVWPFVNPIMLGWLAAAAAPILIHLLSKRRYREESWAAMQFLLAAIEKNSRRIRFEQLLLLALRTLILLLLAAALAEPILGPMLSMGERFRGGVTHWVFVVDGSYSMDYREDGESLFQRAKDLADKIARDSQQGDGFTLVIMADPPTVVIREPAFDAGDVTRELEVLSIRHGGASLEASLAEVERVVNNAKEEHARLTRTQVCIFSDLGRTTWGKVESAAVRKRIASLGEKATLRLFDVGRDGCENSAIVQLRTDEPVMTPGRPIRFSAELQQFQGGEVRRRVQFVVDGRRVEDQSVMVAQDKPASVSFSHRFTQVGAHTVEIRTEGDSLPLDDSRWLSFQVRDSIRVLCVEGKPQAGKFVALALAPGQDGPSPIRAELASEPALLERELANYDCLFLCNIGRIGREEASVLRDYLAQGGSLVCFLGDQVQADSYNRWLNAKDGRPPLLPALIGDARQDAAQYGFNPVDYRHPLVAPFRGQEQAGLLTTPVWKYFELTENPSSDAKIALAFDNGAAAIVEAPVLRGRVILCATAGSTASKIAPGDPTPWSAWAIWPSFPPIVQEMLRLVVADRMQDHNLSVGDPIQGIAAGTDLGDSVSLSGPARHPGDEWNERIPLTLEGGHSRWTFATAFWSGLYRAEYGTPDNAELFAVNVRAAEGDLSRIDSALLPSQFELSDQGLAEGDERLVEDAQQPYFRHLLVLMAACMVAESLLAWHFGNSSA